MLINAIIIYMLKKFLNLKLKSFYVLDLIIVSVIAIGLLIIGTFFDFDFSSALAMNDNVGWMTLSFIFTIPLYVALAIAIDALFIIFLAKNKAKPWFYVGGAVIVFLVSIVLMVMDLEELLEATHAIASTSVIYLVAILIALTLEIVFLVLASFILKNKNIDQLFRIAMFLIISIAISIALTLLIKYVWGRPRYNDILNDGVAFQDWFKPNFEYAFTYKSFPSGHVTKAMTIFPLISTLIILHPRLSKGLYVRLLTYGSLVFVLLLAFIRILSGNHFISDISMSMILSFLTYVITAYFTYVFHYQKKVSD